MSRFHGPQPGAKSDYGSFRRNGPKGVLRAMRALKREEAEERQAAYNKKKAEDAKVLAKQANNLDESGAGK